MANRARDGGWDDGTKELPPNSFPDSRRKTLITDRSCDFHRRSSYRVPVGSIGLASCAREARFGLRADDESHRER